MFNDSFSLKRKGPDGRSAVEVSEAGIAWPFDRELSFG